MLGAVHDHHAEAKPRCRCIGSPVSRVAPLVDPPVAPLAPATTHASARLSLAGEAACFQFNLIAPVLAFLPSTAMRYRWPPVAAKATLLRLPGAVSSLLLTNVRAPTVLPVYTARTVSNAEPKVSMVTRPLEGAV